MAVKKLIEVALPLEKINEESSREKYIHHGHLSTLHLWWARRPLVAARAVIWASLVDDPSSHPEKFPTEKEQNDERTRLFNILEKLVVWENSNDESLLSEAKEEIIKSTNGNIPEFLDPFAGGGAIPLEAHRLGLKAHAHDLNPVAVMINKAIIDIPARFADKAPINPNYKLNHMTQSWIMAQGLAEDVRYYSEIMKMEALKNVGSIYPKVSVPIEHGGGKATVLAWLWARTVKCPNPACECEAPLFRSSYISRKKGRLIWVKPIFNDKHVSFDIKYDSQPEIDGTVSRKGAVCACCGTPIEFSYIREEGRKGRLGAKLMATVAEGSRGRIYINPDYDQVQIANVPMPEDYPDIALPKKALGFRVQLYGLDTFAKLFTKRQLTTLITFSNLVSEIQKLVEKDAVDAGMEDDHIPIRNGGHGAKAYAEAVGVYLAFVIDKLADYHSTLCTWLSEGISHVFSRQALSMVWDYAEGNPFSNSTGCFSNMVDWVVQCISQLPTNLQSEARQADAQTDCGLRNIMISTDPPYYDNIGYADLSDYFYVWLRRSLGGIYPELFSTVLTPKADELIAAPYRHDDSAEKAKDFFENGMLFACKQIYQYARDDIPVTFYYAYKQNDSDSTGMASSGWETMLNSILQSGFSITGTWPIKTEQASRTRSIGSNALASSIVLVCRKRPIDARQTTKRDFVNQLRNDLRVALKKLQESNIAPVDLAQSAIGPGMGVFSRYKQVLESDGTPMSVRNALKLINEEIDAYFNEQVGDMDADSRFCIDLFSQCAFNDIKYGDAEILATAKSASIPMMVSHGVLYAKSGIVHLIDRSDMTEHVDSNEQCIWKLTQQLTEAMSKGGVAACANILANMFGTNVEHARDLAYRLYAIAERKNWTNEAYAYNALVAAWPDIQAKSAELKKMVPEQLDLFSKGSLDQ